MGRTNSLWIVQIYYDKEKINFFKNIECHTLKEVAYITNSNIYDVSNYYHKITKPKGIYEYLIIYKTI
jgi:hypothetical protein|tara:strand:+ start:6072 stop:6275 length:204 start_codon:yes stop_codon:yes gene_type:complete